METATPPTVFLRGLRADNYQVLRSVDLGFSESGIVVVSGKNEQGKSSLIDAIWTALDGKASGPEPIRKGKKEATIEARFQTEERRATEGGLLEPSVELVARRTWKRKKAGGIGQKLEVFADGAKVKGPQGVLDAMLDAVAFDPFRWIDLAKAGTGGRRKQAEQLLERVEVVYPGEELTKMATEVGTEANAADTLGTIRAVDERVRDLRRDAGRELKTLEAQLGEEPPASRPADLEGLRKTLEREREKLKASEAYAADLHSLLVHVEHAKASWASLRGMTVYADATSAGEAAEPWRLVGLDSMAEEERDAALEVCTENELAVREAENELADAGKKNAAHETYLAWRRKRASAEGLRTMIQDANEKLERLEELKEEALAGADLPAGLGVDVTGGLTYKGHPFPEQASGEEQITVALEVAAACRPRLRLVRIHDGNRLDKEHREALGAKLEERGWLALMEMVVDDAQKLGVGIVIEDGEVIADRREGAN